MENMNHAEQVELTQAIMGILDSWGLPAAQQIILLALPEKTPTRALRRYRDSTPFPDTSAVRERLEHIVGIYDALRTTYPHNPSMGAMWIKQPNRRFEDRSPLRAMVDDGMPGILKVRAHLDCTFDWLINP